MVQWSKKDTHNLCETQSRAHCFTLTDAPKTNQRVVLCAHEMQLNYSSAGVDTGARFAGNYCPNDRQQQSAEILFKGITCFFRLEKRIFTTDFRGPIR